MPKITCTEVMASKAIPDRRNAACDPNWASTKMDTIRITAVTTIDPIRCGITVVRWKRYAAPRAICDGTNAQQKIAIDLSDGQPPSSTICGASRQLLEVATASPTEAAKRRWRLTSTLASATGAAEPCREPNAPATTSRN